ncbi:MAG: ATP-binding protein [Chloroflexota bacterium]
MKNVVGGFQRRTNGSFQPYLAAVLLTSLASALIGAITRVAEVPNIPLVYVPAILFIAVYFGTWPSLLAATMAVLEYDFFFLKPFYTLSIAQAADFLAFLVFVIVALLTSQLAARARGWADSAQRRAAELSMLADLSQSLMAGHDVERILNAVTERIVAVFGVDRCAIFVPDDDGRPALAAETPAGAGTDRAGHSTATWVLRRGTQVWLPSGKPDEVDTQRTYVPLRTAQRVLGVMEVGKLPGRALDESQRQLLTNFGAQAALVIAQAQSEEARNRLTVLEESDRLKSTLLNAVSHDLRTPLASIKASASAMLLPGSRWSAGQQRELLVTIDQEVDRLNRLVGNLLDLSRIEAGVLMPALEWYDVKEIVDGVLPRIRHLIGDHQFSTELEPDLGAVQVDLVRVEALMMNLLENAVKYTPPDSPISLRVRQNDLGVSFAVVDHGAGIPLAHRERIFQSFFQGQQFGDRRPGAGLGLAICRGVARAHGGDMSIEQTPGGGSTFVFTLPESRVAREVTV